MQEIRGFGTCFSELGALALGSIPNDEKKAFLDELFDEDKCNFNYCRTPMGASDFSTDFYSYNETDGDFEMKNFSIQNDSFYCYPKKQNVVTKLAFATEILYEMHASKTKKGAQKA